MAGERIKTSSSVSRDNWFSYRNPPLPSTAPALSTLYREFADPGYLLVWISTSLSTPPRTLYTLRSSLSAPLISRIRFAPLVSLRVAHSSKSSVQSFFTGSMFSSVAIRPDDRCVLQRKPFAKFASVKLQDAQHFNE